ncbi:MAG: ABC transporter permease, partial [Blastocatellia bacterium]
ARAGARGTSGAPPYPCFERFRDQNKTFAGMAAFTQITQRVVIDGQVEEVRGQQVSGNYFSLLGIQPLLGRMLSPADDSISGKGGPDGAVGVISYNYWTRRFGRNPDVIGKAVQVGGNSVTIVGVTPPDFHGLYPGVEINLSVPIMTADAGMLAEKNSWWFKGVGRLKPGVRPEQARADLDTIYRSFINEIGGFNEYRRDHSARIELPPAGRGLDTLRRQYDRPLQTLMGIVALVLLIACANVANLLLARATARRKEFAVRLALGASRWRLLRQMGVESLLLVTLGGLLGLLIARWGSAFLASFFATGPNRLFLDLPLDGRVLIFTAVVALLTCLLFGLAPALHATRVNPSPALKDGGDGRASSRSRFGKLLVVAQVALSLLLLVGAGLFLRSLQNLKNLDPGFRSAGVLMLRVDPQSRKYQRPQLNAFWQEALTRVKAIPGVSAASLSALSPLDGSDRGVMIEVSGFTPNAERDRGISLNHVSPGYFDTMGIAVLQGRSFSERDNESSSKVAVLNETAARFYFGDQNPIGRQLRFLAPRIADSYEIVGVVRDSKHIGLREKIPRLLYIPTSQAVQGMGWLKLAARTGGAPAALIKPIRNEIGSIGTDILVTNVITLEEQVGQTLLQERLLAWLASLFGLLALLLACIGLYGVMSYDVERRMREIGIRMALGASAQQVVRLVLRQTLVWVALGVAIGLGAALATTRWVESLLFGLKPNDPLTIGLAALALLAVAGVAGYLPARRAASVDPLVALRRE